MTSILSPLGASLPRRWSRIVVFLIAPLLSLRLHAQCGLTMVESQPDEALLGSIVMRATMNAPGADGITFTYQAPNGNIQYYGLPCSDPTNCFVRLFLDCTEMEKGEPGIFKVTATGHCDAGYQSIGPVGVNVDIGSPTGSLTPFWDADGIFRVTIKYDFPLGVDDGNVWICVPTASGQCNGPVNGTARYFAHGSAEYTWRPTVGGSIALYLHGCDTAGSSGSSGTFLSSAVVVQPDKTPDNGQVGGQLIQPQNLPASVGSSHQTLTFGNGSYNLDDQILLWADRRGIPPQLIKAIMDRETASQFDPLEWRYEPLTTDWDNFAPSPYGQNQRALQKYAPYRMEFDSAHQRGIWLIDGEDVHPRHKYYIDAQHTTPIPDSQMFVTAYQLYQANDNWQNWLANLHSVSKKALLMSSQVSTALAWSADTTLASSYGLMQVLFAESFDNYGYNGINGRRRPYYLFDTPPNVAAGGGSIQVGSGVYITKYRWENGFNGTGNFSPAYDTTAKLDDDYENGLMGYNGSFCQQPTCYGPDTMKRMTKYIPVPSTSLFQ